MEYGKDLIKKQVRELINQGHIAPENIPTIELYMDQVTTFMDKYLSGYKRSEEDKTLTKTMINNYTKNDLLPSPEKKRYGSEHMILLIYIYYLKNVMPISDIQTILGPMLNEYFGDVKGEISLMDIYDSIYQMETRQYFDTEASIIKSLELAEQEFSKETDEYLNKFAFLSLLSYDIFMKKKLMERIIDEMAKEQEALKKAEEQKEAAKKQNSKKDVKKAASNKKESVDKKKK